MNLKIFLKNNSRLTLLLLLTTITSIILLGLNKKATLNTQAWYNNSWLYRRAITVGNTSGTTLTNAEVLISINTSSIISSGKMLSTCNDIRLVDSNDTTLLSFWIEGNCNTSATQIWVRIPSLPNGGKTIYLYYGNSSAGSGEVAWGGTFYMFSTAACPANWTRNASYDNRLIRVAATAGAQGGADSHTHGNISLTTGNPSINVKVPNFPNGGLGYPLAYADHKHTYTVSSNWAVNIPPYITTIFCSANKFTGITTGMRGINLSTPGTGWIYSDSWAGYYLRPSTSAGATGGASTHSHTTTGGFTTANLTVSGQGDSWGGGPTDASATTDTHTTNSGSTGTANNDPANVSVRLLAPTANGTNAFAGIGLLASTVPPFGWSQINSYNDRILKITNGSLALGGVDSHLHSVTITATAANGGVYDAYAVAPDTQPSITAAVQHTHTASGNTGYASSVPAYTTAILIQRKSSYTTSVGAEELSNLAPTAPTNLSISPATVYASTNPSFRAQFNDPNAGDTGVYYQIQVNTNSSFTGTSMWDSGQKAMTATAIGSLSPSITYAGSTLLGGNTYYWRIRFWDNIGAVSPFSAVVSFPVLSSPSVPLNLGATAGNNAVSLSWNVPSSDGGAAITDYVIRYSTDGSTWTTFNDGTSTNTTATVTGLTNGTLYYFQVAAVNSVGTGPYTSSVTSTPINPAPIFSNITNTSPVSPGSNITWNATASDTGGQVKLLVCKTPSMTNGVCDGGQWCSSSLVTTNPSCSYSVPNPTVNGTYNAYTYVVDNQNAPATGAIQGTNSSFVVSSVAPTIAANLVLLNEGNAINLLEGTTTGVTLSGTVVSSNSCTSITSVTGYIYRSGVGYTGCDTLVEGNDNYCYPEVACTLNPGSCVDSSDDSADYTCTVNIQYFADPTDINTQYDSQNWLGTIKATNSNNLTASAETSTGVELNSLTAFSVTTTLNYGSLSVGESNNPLDRILVTTTTGNVGLDQQHAGNGVGMCIDFPLCAIGTPIPLANQKYWTSASTAYVSGTSLTATATEVELNIPKATSTTAVSRNVWWGILIPSLTIPGEYTGQNIITAIKGEIVDW